MPTPFSRAEIFPVENGPEDFRKFDVVSVSGSVLTGTAEMLNGNVQHGYACPCFVSPDDLHEGGPEFREFPFRMIEFAVGGTFTPEAFECLEQFPDLEVVVVRSNAWNKDWEHKKMDTLSSLWNGSKTEKLKLPNLKLFRLFDGPDHLVDFDAARKNRPGLRIVQTRSVDLDDEDLSHAKQMLADQIGSFGETVQIEDTWCPSAAAMGSTFVAMETPFEVEWKCNSKWLGRLKPGHWIFPCDKCAINLAANFGIPTGRACSACKKVRAMKAETTRGGSSASSAVGTGGVAGVKKGGSSKASRKLY